MVLGPCPDSSADATPTTRQPVPRARRVREPRRQPSRTRRAIRTPRVLPAPGSVGRPLGARSSLSRADPLALPHPASIWLCQCIPQSNAAGPPQNSGPGRCRAAVRNLASPPATAHAQPAPRTSLQTPALPHPRAELDSIYMGRQSSSPALSPRMPARPLPADPLQRRISARISKHPSSRVG